MKAAQAAQDPGRLVLEAPGARGTMMLLREANVAHPIEDPLEADLRLDAGERPARAGMVAAAEGDVLLRVGTVDADLGGAPETPRVPVGRAVQHHERGAGGDLHAGQGRGAAGETEVGLSRALGPGRPLRRAGVVLRGVRRKSVFTGLSIRSASSTKSGMRSRWFRSSS